MFDIIAMDELVVDLIDNVSVKQAGGVLRLLDALPWANKFRTPPR